MADVTTFDIAQQDILEWLSAKKISDSTKEKYKDSIASLCDSIVSGDLTVDASTKELTYYLGFPVEIAGVPIDKITFKPRLSMDVIKSKTASLTPGDSEGRVLAYASALTGQNVLALQKMDTSDYSVVQNIVIFFMAK